MILNLNEKEYRDLIVNLSENEGVQTSLKPDFENHKNHEAYVVLKMVSEDGSNEFQGLIAAELYNLSSGLVATISALLVPERFEGKEYDDVLIYHLVNKIKEEYKDCQLLNVIVPEDQTPVYEKNNFEITSKGRFSKVQNKFPNVRLSNNLK